jgi:putative phosphoribosyl transferase
VTVRGVDLACELHSRIGTAATILATGDDARAVAEAAERAGFSVVLAELLAPRERIAERTTGVAFSSSLLADRLSGWLDWAMQDPRLPVGVFAGGAATAAALAVAAKSPRIGALITRGGCPDRAGALLARIDCPTLLAVGAGDPEALDRAHRAVRQMTAPARIHVLGGNGSEIAALAIAWFRTQLVAAQELRLG